MAPSKSTPPRCGIVVARRLPGSKSNSLPCCPSPLCDGAWTLSHMSKTISWVNCVRRHRHVQRQEWPSNEDLQAQLAEPYSRCQQVSAFASLVRGSCRSEPPGSSAAGRSNRQALRGSRSWSAPAGQILDPSGNRHNACDIGNACAACGTQATRICNRSVRQGSPGDRDEYRQHGMASTNSLVTSTTSMPRRSRKIPPVKG